MIEVRVRFFTDTHAPAGQILPKHGHAVGEVRLAKNAAHGIHPGKPIMFNSMSEVPYAIERALRDHEIKMHMSSRERRYRN